MLKFEENLASRVSGALQPMLGVSVTVTASNGLLATIYADDESTVLANPMTTDANGYFGFKAANGEYTLTFAGAQIETAKREIELYDADDDPPLTLAQAALPTGAERIGFSSDGVPTTLANAMSNALKNQQQRMHMKRIAHRLPLMFPDYAALLAENGHDLLYPQCFAIDETANEIHILNGPGGGTYTAAWVAVYDRTTEQYKTCYGIAGTAGGEGLTIRYEDGRRYAYTRTNGESIGKTDITALPAPRTILTPGSTHAVGIQLEMAYRNGTFIIEQNAAPVGSVATRTVCGLFDDSLTLKGAVYFDKIDTGFTTLADSPYAQYIPKRQGMALGDGYIITSHGGGYVPGTDQPYHFTHQGVKVYNMSGERVAESIMHPDAMIEVLRASGVNTGRVENEGVVVDRDGRVFTLYVVKGRFDVPAPTTDGLIIFEEFSSAPDAIDFSPAVKSYPSYQQARLTGGIYPRSNGGVVRNPLTGGQFTTLDEILDFMSATDFREFSFYSTAVSLKDINGANFPAATMVLIRNANNSTFFMSLLGSSQSTDYVIAGTPGARTQVQMPARGYFNEMRIANAFGDNAGKSGIIRGLHYSNAQADVQGVNIQSTQSATTMYWGGGSGAYNAATQHLWYAASSTTTKTGTVRMRLDDADGLTLVPSSSAVPNNNGEMLFELTSNTSLTVRVRGSDGVVRSSVIPLA